MTGRSLAPSHGVAAEVEPLIPRSLPPEPILPERLGYAVDVATDRDRERRALAPAALATPTAAEREAALAAVKAYEVLLEQPAWPLLLAQWLKPVNAAVRNPQTREDFAARCAGIMAMLGDDIPAAALTETTRRALRVEFFPSAEDVRRVVEPIVVRWRTRRAALLAIARRPAVRPAPSGPLPMTQAEAEDALARLQAAPQDRWTRIGLAQLQARLQREAPDLAEKLAPTFDSLAARASAVPLAAAPETSPVRPSHLTAEHAAAARAALAARRACR